MARSKCRCGNVNLWKADEPQSDEWLLVPFPDIPDEAVGVIGVGAQAAICSACGRLWVDWRGDDSLAEYVPADPDAPPVRPTGQRRTG